MKCTAPKSYYFLNKAPKEIFLPFQHSTNTVTLSHSPKPPPCLLPSAAPGFTRPPLCAEEAALRRALEHADGDHSSLIQVYEAFIQSEWPTLHSHKEFQIFPGEVACQLADSSLVKGWALPGVSRAMVVAVPFPLLGGADEAWCQARGLSWAALCQARKLREELLELMQRIELPLSPPAFGSEQNRRNLQKALLSGYFLQVIKEKAKGTNISVAPLKLGS